MKKILVFVVLLMFFTPSFADLVKAKAISPISTSSPLEVITVRLMSKLVLNNGEELSFRYVLIGKIVNITAPEKGKDATFSYKIDGYIDCQDKYHQIKSDEILHFNKEKTNEIVLSKAPLPKNKKNKSYAKTAKSKEIFKKTFMPYKMGSEIEINPNQIIYFDN